MDYDGTITRSVHSDPPVLDFSGSSILPTGARLNGVRPMLSGKQLEEYLSKNTECLWTLIRQFCRGEIESICHADKYVENIKQCIQQSSDVQLLGVDWAVLWFAEEILEVYTELHNCL